MKLRLILDNLRSIYNVGSIFRTAETFGVELIYCAGYTATPKHLVMTKTALGAEKLVPWQKVETTAAAIDLARADGYKILALELTAAAVKLSFRTGAAWGDKIVLIVGNETEGVTPGILKLVDRAVMIPMVGHKESLNVAVATGIATFVLTHNK